MQCHCLAAAEQMAAPSQVVVRHRAEVDPRLMYSAHIRRRIREDATNFCPVAELRLPNVVVVCHIRLQSGLRRSTRCQLDFKLTFLQPVQEHPQRRMRGSKVGIQAVVPAFGCVSGARPVVVIVIPKFRGKVSRNPGSKEIIRQVMKLKVSGNWTSCWRESQPPVPYQGDGESRQSSHCHQLPYPVVYGRIPSVFVLFLEPNLDTRSLWHNKCRSKKIHKHYSSIKKSHVIC